MIAIETNEPQRVSTDQAKPQRAAFEIKNKESRLILPSCETKSNEQSKKTSLKSKNVARKPRSYSFGGGKKKTKKHKGHKKKGKTKRKTKRKKGILKTRKKKKKSTKRK